MADIGNDVVGGNRQALTDVLQLLVPTTDLLNQYHEALWCGIAGSLVNLHSPPLPEPTIKVLVYIGFGAERYRYPANLPKVAATGGPQCKAFPWCPSSRAAVRGRRHRRQPDGVRQPGNSC